MKLIDQLLTKLWDKLGYARSAKLKPIFTLTGQFKWTGVKQMAKYFTNDEVSGLNPRLVVLLDQMREASEIPMIITCGLRTLTKNEEVSGVKDSAHLKGLAVDIRCADSVSRYKLLMAAYKVGFKRIGVETRHIHLDISEDLPQNVAWLGISQ